MSCAAPGWVTNPASSLLPTFQSVKFSYSGTLAMGATATFAWTTRAPVFDTSFDRGGTSSTNPYEFLEVCLPQAAPSNTQHCPRAVNSFAYGANATNLPPGVPAPSRLYAEPPAVEVRVIAPPRPNGIGNRVWLDRNFDGLQGTDTTPTGEPGLANVYVELYQANILVPGSYVLAGYTYTDVNGNYLFSGGAAGLPDGAYKVRFYPPAGYYVSPRDVTGPATDMGPPDPGVAPGTNTDDDSDVSRTAAGSNGFGTYYETTNVVLGDNDNTNVGTPSQGEIDRTWDMGLWFAQPAIDVVKVTKDTAWPDTAAGDGVSIIQGRALTWIYTVTNTGNTRLQNVTLSDNGGPNPTFAVTNCTITAPGTNADGLLSSATAPIALNRGATMRCTATGTAGRVTYANIATITGTPRQDNGAAIVAAGVPATVTDTDPSSYTSGKYDLALAKTVGTLNLATGNVTFTITVLNEGTVASGSFGVTDVLPAGVSMVGNAIPVQTSSVGGTIVWANQPSLAAGASRTFTVNAHVDDYLVRPYRNYAEITADSSALTTTGGVSTPTTDSDSTPDALIGNDNTGNGIAAGNGYGPVGTPNATVDNANITQAGSRLFPNPGDDANDGEDDADIADINPTITYDLALAKVPGNSPVGLATNPTFLVRVYNQGNVPSGTVVVHDRIPAGLTFTTTGSTAGCVASPGNLVVCTLTTIAPAASRLITLATTVDGTPDNFSTAPWRNWAEIYSDQAQLLYAVNDSDSTPEITQANGIGSNSAPPPGENYVGVTTAGAAYATPAGSDEDDNDDGIATTSVRYDLALAKTIGTIDLDSGLITYTLTIANQGTVASGSYSVVDVLPIGLAIDGTPSPAPTTTTGSSITGTTLTWTNLPSLTSGSSRTVTFTARIADYTQRPFRNFAEISADSSQLLYLIDDSDSTPDTNTANDGAYGAIGSSPIDNLSITDAGVIGGDPQDDADIGDANPVITYDLALAKVAGNSPVGLGSAPVFQVRVYNQGTVPSGAVVVRDRIPTGLTFDPAGSTAACIDAGANFVVCTLASLSAGQSTLLTLATTIDGSPDDFSTAPWRNWAEIYSDSAQAIYGIDDADSAPETTQANGIGADSSLPGDTYTGVTTAGPAYATPGAPDEDDNDDGIAATSVRYDLALAKTVANIDVANGTMDYTITIENQGTVGSGLYSVIDVLPSGLALDGSPAPAATSVTGSSLTGTTITWVDLANLAPGASITITFSARILDYTQRPFRNVAEISADSGRTLYGLNDADSTPDSNTTNDGAYGAIGASPLDNLSIADAGVIGGDPQDDADIADVAPVITYDLALAKVADATLVTQTDTITYTITVQNQGNVRSGAFVVTDTVPEGLAFAGSADGGVFVDANPDLVTFAGTDLAPGALRSYTWTATVADLTKRPYRNVAEISDDSALELYATIDTDSTPDTTTTNDGAYGPAGTPSPIDSITVADAGVRGGDPQDDADIADVDLDDLRYDLALAKTVAAAATTFDGLITFTITVQNQGNLDSRQVQVTDWIPQGLAVVSLDGATDNGDGTVTWTLPNVAVGATLTRLLTVRVVDTSRRPFRNIAEITADGADFYDVTAGNVVDVEDLDSTPDADRANDGTYGPVMAAGGIDNTEPNAVGQAGAGPDPEDDADIADVDLQVLYDLTLVKTGPASIDPAGVARFTVTILNQGNVPSGTFTVTDEVPAGLVAVSASNGGDLTDATARVVWTGLPSLAPGATTTLTVDMRITDLSRRPFTNIAEITADGADAYDVAAVPDAPGRPATPAADVEDDDSITDADVANDVMVDQVSLPATQRNNALVDEDDHDIAVLDADVVYDLALVKTVASPLVAPDGTAVFAITVANQGTVASRTFTVVDTLPAGTAFVSADNGGAADASGTTVTWNLPSLAAGASTTVTLTLRPTDLGRRPYRNVAEITADGAAGYSTLADPVSDSDSTPGDPGTSSADSTSIAEAGAGIDSGFDDEDVAGFDVLLTYDLALIKNVVPGQNYQRGNPITYEIQVKNQGNVASNRYSVQDVIPGGMSFVSATSGGSFVAGTVFWTDLPSLAPGQIATLTLQLRLDDVTRAQYRNVAEISRDGSSQYSTPAVTVADEDSTPNDNPNDDPVLDATNVNVDTTAGDEDDHDIAVLDTAAIAADNSAPENPTLPVTGAQLATMLLAAIASLGSGLLLSSPRRPRRRARAR
ncbi:MAG: SdrD B-like domain-containing protein [Actinomycetota bacterium]